MLPLVVFLLGAASCVTISTKGELVWLLIDVDVEVLGCPEANAEVRMTFPLVCLYLKRKRKALGLLHKNKKQNKTVLLLSSE